MIRIREFLKGSLNKMNSVVIPVFSVILFILLIVSIFIFKIPIFEKKQNSENLSGYSRGVGEVLALNNLPNVCDIADRQFQMYVSGTDGNVMLRTDEAGRNEFVPMQVVRYDPDKKWLSYYGKIKAGSILMTMRYTPQNQQTCSVLIISEQKSKKSFSEDGIIVDRFLQK